MKAQTKRAKPKAKKHSDERKAISMVKLVGISMKLREHNNHLQGLYAELGKLVFDQHRRPDAGAPKQLSAVMTGIADRINELRKKIERLEREAKALQKAA